MLERVPRLRIGPELAAGSSEPSATLTRRAMLGLLGAAVWVGQPRRLSAAPAAEPFAVRDLHVEGDRRLGQRFTLLVPTARASSRPLPLLVALHGLGETGDPRAGAFAWLERYGLGEAYRRLCAPPLRRESRHPYWSTERLAEVNASLAAQPFRGLAVACPVTPNVYRAPDRQRLLDEYAAWIVEVVVPRARREAGCAAGAAHTSLDGCSLGGYVGLEVFLRKPADFGAWGSVQGALGQHRVAGYADRLAALGARLGPRPIHLETSSEDPFHAVNVELSRALRQRNVPHELRIGRGPHNQPWLREEGTVEMLLWHDRLPR